jgi:hypothetical protein
MMNLPSSSSMDKKDIAARKIQKFLREKMVHLFGWRRNFRKIDGENLRKLRHQAATNVTSFSSLVPLSVSLSNPHPVLSKMKNCTPFTLRTLADPQLTTTQQSNATASTTRPESAPDILRSRSQSRVGLLTKKSSHNLLRPTTAPIQTFITEDRDDRERDAGSPPNTPPSSRKDILSLCRQRRASSVSAMLTARKMLFSDPHAASRPATSQGRDLQEDDEEDEESAEEEVGEEDDEKVRAEASRLKKRQKRKDRKQRQLEKMMHGYSSFSFLSNTL